MLPHANVLSITDGPHLQSISVFSSSLESRSYVTSTLTTHSGSGSAHVPLERYRLPRPFFTDRSTMRHEPIQCQCHHGHGDITLSGSARHIRDTDATCGGSAPETYVKYVLRTSAIRWRRGADYYALTRLRTIRRLHIARSGTADLHTQMTRARRRCAMEARLTRAYGVYTLELPLKISSPEAAPKSFDRGII